MLSHIGEHQLLCKLMTMGLPFIVVGAIIPTKDNSQLDDIMFQMIQNL
uniref:Uncharacterized protein n=1 Tax=Anguilla anguilla TaxID=7936 RepID=A0A0E9SM86_ANGAN